jgi:hypothetical protein
MSLAVTPALLQQAERGRVQDEAFVSCVRESLPYAYQLVERLVREMPHSLDVFADNQIPPPNEEARGQLLRMLASDSMRAAMERYFGVKLAFQNCHRLAVFPPSAVDSDAYREFVSPRAQLLNQSPDLVNC